MNWWNNYLGVYSKSFFSHTGEKQEFSDVHMEKIRELPWEEILCRDIPVAPPADCEYWKEKTILC